MAGVAKVAVAAPVYTSGACLFQKCRVFEVIPCFLLLLGR